MPLTLPLINLLFQEGIAFLLDVEVDDTAEFFLPNFQAVNVDVVADVSVNVYGVVRRWRRGGRGRIVKGITRMICENCGVVVRACGWDEQCG